MGIADEKYVSLTTFRANGQPVATPVWIVPLGPTTAGFTTESTSGKVKRIRNNPKVTLRPCDMRGRVRDGTPESTAIASVLMGADAKPVHDAVKSKYRVMVALMGVGQKLRSVVRRGRPAEDCAIHLRLD